jgi:hypothetical protein
MCSSSFGVFLAGDCPSPTALGLQEIVDLADRDRALADGGGDAFD